MKSLEYTSFTIRSFDYSDADYGATVALWNAAHPDNPSSVYFQRREDEWLTSEPGRVVYRALAVLDETTAEPGRCVGAGHFMHKPWSYHPQKFGIYITVHPAYLSAGVEQALYQHLWQAMQPHEPITLESLAYENDAHMLSFLERQGFRVVQRGASSNLNTADFDPQAYAGLLDRVAASGVRIRTLTEMLAEDPNYLRRLHALESELVTYVPYYDATVDPPLFETWLKGFSENPDLLPEANLVATDGDKLIGMTNLWASQATDRILYTGFTGVLPAYRRSGIATALKVRALTYAKGHPTSDGAPPAVRTGNEENNPMLQINLRLGFVEMPAELILVKGLA